MSPWCRLLDPSSFAPWQADANAPGVSLAGTGLLAGHRVAVAALSPRRLARAAQSLDGGRDLEPLLERAGRDELPLVLVTSERDAAWPAARAQGRLLLRGARLHLAIPIHLRRIEELRATLAALLDALTYPVRRSDVALAPISYGGDPS